MVPLVQPSCAGFSEVRFRVFGLVESFDACQPYSYGNLYTFLLWRLRFASISVVFPGDWASANSKLLNLISRRCRDNTQVFVDFRQQFSGKKVKAARGITDVRVNGCVMNGCVMNGCVPHSNPCDYITGGSLFNHAPYCRVDTCMLHSCKTLHLFCEEMLCLRVRSSSGLNKEPTLSAQTVNLSSCAITSICLLPAVCHDASADRVLLNAS